jgi:putative N6-adenine-specific DNA methylase
MNNQYFATCPRGIESVLADELRALGAAQIEATGGGVGFAGDWALALSANLHSRIATRILLRLGRGRYQREDDIYHLAKNVRWSEWFGHDETIRIFVTAVKSPLKSLEFVTLRIKDAVCDRFRDDTGERPSVDTREPDMRIHAFLTETECTLYLDTSGAPLYQRGLRQKTVEAPLKENLAAGILRLAGWTPEVALFDPMCGSGTLLLEAAQVALNVAPGIRRSFAFQQMKCFDDTEWQRVVAAAKAAQRQPEDLQNYAGAAAGIFGADRDPVAYRATLANLDRAGLLSAVKLSTGDALDAVPPAPSGIWISNPPYGVRLSEQEEMAEFYPKLGSVLKQRFAGWNCYLLSGDMRLPKLVGLKPSRKTPLFNGDIDCRLFEFKMVAGSNRREKGGEGRADGQG